MALLYALYTYEFKFQYVARCIREYGYKPALRTVFSPISSHKNPIYNFVNIFMPALRTVSSPASFHKNPRYNFVNIFKIKI